jgi:hypothetical protein
MLNIDAFRELCHRASIETDPPKRQNLKDALQLMLRTQQIEAHRVEKNPSLKAN